MELIKLFEENFKPYAIVPVTGLSKSYIVENGYSKNDIELLINEGKIEKIDLDGYRMTHTHLKQFAGSSYKYIPEFIIDKYTL
jgi:hypothetical protein